LHQGNQWGDDDANSFFCECGYLKADGFPTAGGQEGKGILVFKDRLNDILLQGAKLRVTPVLLQYVMDILHVNSNLPKIA
jgi:hypothetical protein